jgi:acetolactate decarboxylase
MTNSKTFAKIKHVFTAPTTRRWSWTCLIFALCGVAAVAASDVVVQHKGSLRAVHGGDTQGMQLLAPLLARPGLVALGPMAQLDGEITAVDGKLWVSKVKGSKQLETSTDAQSAAAFLVWAHVTQWREPVALSRAAKDHGALEAVIEQAAREAGLDTSQAFPFKLVGVADQIDYHVLAPLPAKGHGGHSGHGAPAASTDHKSQAVNLKLVGKEATLVGFYSNKHEGVFTHRGSRVHLHVVDADGHTGHVDEISAPAGMRIAFAQR